MELKVKKLHHDAIIPKYQSEGAACFDIHAVVRNDMNNNQLYEGHPAVIRTGLAFEVPEGHVMLVYSRSSHGFNYSTRLGNCVGVIDSDYRGELELKLIRDASVEELMRIGNGDRIAQAMVIPVQQVKLVEVDELSETVRGEGGFGSTGK